MTRLMYRHLAALLVLVVLLGGCAGDTRQVPYSVIPHPDGHLYVGDLVSFEILAPGEWLNQSVTVSFEGQELGATTFSPYGIGGRVQGTFWWVWDTAGLEPGKYNLTFSLADGMSWNQQFRLYPASRLPGSRIRRQPGTPLSPIAVPSITSPAPTPPATWLTWLLWRMRNRLRLPPNLAPALQERIDLVFMPRVIGHGGFAWNGVYISYLDENYVGSELDMVLHHEFVHYYDSWVGGEYLPSMLREGLAVYYSGGHFKPEPIAERAAALLDLGWYIPLETLADDFYNQQHDIGYLEAAALVQYFHETYGPGSFAEFYRTITYQEGMSDSQLLDAELQQSFSLSLAELETSFISYLSAQTVTDEIRRDLELTVADYDLVRRYQSLLDPSAYFLTAWLPDGLVMRERGIVADFTRRPVAWQNLLVEGWIRRANTNLFAGEYESAEQDIYWTNRLLDILDK